VRGDGELFLTTDEHGFNSAAKEHKELKTFLLRIGWGQRYLILECKVGIFEDVVYEDDEFAHDGRKGDFGWFARRPQPLVKLFKLAVGMGGDECGHVEGASDGSASTANAAASMPMDGKLMWRCTPATFRRELSVPSSNNLV